MTETHRESADEVEGLADAARHLLQELQKGSPGRRRGGKSRQTIRHQTSLLVQEVAFVGQIPIPLALLVSHLLADPKCKQLGRINTPRAGDAVASEPSCVHCARRMSERRQLRHAHAILAQRVVAHTIGLTDRTAAKFEAAATAEARFDRDPTGRAPSVANIAEIERQGGPRRSTVVRYRKMPTFWRRVENIRNGAEPLASAGDGNYLSLRFSDEVLQCNGR